MSDFFEVVGHKNIFCSGQEMLFSSGLKSNNLVWLLWFHVISHIPLSRSICSGRPPFVSPKYCSLCGLLLNLSAWCYFCLQSLTTLSPPVSSFLQVVASDGVRAMMESALTARDRVGVQDFVLLENYTSEAAFIENLRKRFKENLIYVSSRRKWHQSVAWIFVLCPYCARTCLVKHPPKLEFYQHTSL